MQLQRFFLGLCVYHQLDFCNQAVYYVAIHGFIQILDHAFLPNLPETVHQKEQANHQARNQPHEQQRIHLFQKMITNKKEKEDEASFNRKRLESVSNHHNTTARQHQNQKKQQKLLQQSH